MTHKTTLFGAIVLLAAGGLLGYYATQTSNPAMHDAHEQHQEQDDSHHQDSHDQAGHHDESRETHISLEAAQNAGIETAPSRPVTIHDEVLLYGSVRLNEDLLYHPGARFGGMIRAVHVSAGDWVAKGALLASLENTDTLALYDVRAPGDGVVLSRNASVGMTADGPLFTIADTRQLWADFAAFPADRMQLESGQLIRIDAVDSGRPLISEIKFLAPLGSQRSQAGLVRALLPNPDERWLPGMMLTGTVSVGQSPVPVAVELAAVQTLDDQPVVFVLQGNAYRAVPVTLGIRDSQHVEVLTGLEAGMEVVSRGSYVIKADLLKAGAAHAH